MEQFKVRGQTYSAWGKMQCSDQRPHAPHSWSSEVTVYGPYFCEGIHTTCPCIVKCGHPIDYHFVRAHENGLISICLECHIELTAEIDRLKKEVEAAKEQLREFAEDVAYQYAYERAGCLTTGGLSTMETAFDILGWDDPHKLEGDSK